MKLTLSGGTLKTWTDWILGRNKLKDGPGKYIGSDRVHGTNRPKNQDPTDEPKTDPKAPSPPSD